MGCRWHLRGFPVEMPFLAVPKWGAEFGFWNSMWLLFLRGKKYSFFKIGTLKSCQLPREGATPLWASWGCQGAAGSHSHITPQPSSSWGVPRNPNPSSSILLGSDTRITQITCPRLPEGNREKIWGQPARDPFPGDARPFLGDPWSQSWSGLGLPRGVPPTQGFPARLAEGFGPRRLLPSAVPRQGGDAPMARVPTRGCAWSSDSLVGSCLRLLKAFPLLVPPRSSHYHPKSSFSMGFVGGEGTWMHFMLQKPFSQTSRGVCALAAG